MILLQIQKSMKTNRNVNWFFISLWLWLCIGCFSHKYISKQNLAYLYSDAEIILKPEYLLYHTSKDTSILYFKINTSELLYARDGFMSNFKAKFSISYELLESYESKQTLDSLTFYYEDSVTTIKHSFIIDSLFLKIPYGNNYVIKLTASDYNRKKYFISYMNIYKTNIFSIQNYLLLDNEDKPLFSSYLKNKQKFRIIYNNDSVTQLYVKYYQNTFPIATPPFHLHAGKTTTIYPDSIFILALEKGLSPLMDFPDEGIYRIMLDTGYKECFTLFRFHEDFPDITLAEQMLYSSRYLTTRQEYENMIIMADKKEAIDNFWLDMAGNADRARQLVKTYYGRVKQGNKYFTSYHEGWKTDRGMVYIIYGPPTTVYKSSTYENWIYGDATNFKSLNFYFYKVENPFSENDYMLSKSEIFRDSWYYAVSNWRR